MGAVPEGGHVIFDPHPDTKTNPKLGPHLKIGPHWHPPARAMRLGEYRRKIALAVTVTGDIYQLHVLRAQGKASGAAIANVPETPQADNDAMVIDMENVIDEACRRIKQGKAELEETIREACQKSAIVTLKKIKLTIGA